MPPFSQESGKVLAAGAHAMTLPMVQPLVNGIADI
jgi:hypothetical protein